MAIGFHLCYNHTTQHSNSNSEFSQNAYMRLFIHLVIPLECLNFLELLTSENLDGCWRQEKEWDSSLSKIVILGFLGNYKMSHQFYNLFLKIKRKMTTLNIHTDCMTRGRHACPGSFWGRFRSEPGNEGDEGKDPDCLWVLGHRPQSFSARRELEDQYAQHPLLRNWGTEMLGACQLTRD